MELVGSGAAVQAPRAAGVNDFAECDPRPASLCWRLRIDRRSVRTYVLTVFAFSSAFWIFGPKLGDLTSLTHAPVPASALMLVCPAVTAVFALVRKDDVNLGTWLRACVRRPVAVTWRWRLATIASFPAIIAGSYVVSALVGRDQPTPTVDWAVVPSVLVVYALSALAEEMGWTAYATDPLLARYGFWATGLGLGAIWAAWHLIPYVQGGHSAGWIAGQCVFTVLSRVIIVDIYLHTDRSTLAAAAAHASSNVAWSLYPIAGSGYSPWAAAFVAASWIVVVTGSRSHPSPEARHPGARRPARET